MAGPFRRYRGDVEMHFDSGEASLVRQLVEDLLSRLGAVDDAEPVADPVLRRLFPDGYNDDPEAASELRSLIQDDLRDGKIGSARIVLESLADLPPSGRLRLGADQSGAWLGTLNDLRLTLGTALDVTDDTDLELEGDDETESFALSVYGFLGWLQGNLVEALIS
jgi:hypothetical protein